MVKMCVECLMVVVMCMGSHHAWTLRRRSNEAESEISFLGTDSAGSGTELEPEQMLQNALVLPESYLNSQHFQGEQLDILQLFQTVQRVGVTAAVNGQSFPPVLTYGDTLAVNGHRQSFQPITSVHTFTPESNQEPSDQNGDESEGNGEEPEVESCDDRSSSSCFSASARVTLENGKSVTMSELQVGDRVQTDGRSTFSTVKAFLKKQHSITTMYKSLVTSRNTTISLTGDHLVYARKSTVDKFYPMYANDISVDDELLVQRHQLLTIAKVTKTSKFIMQGAFVPLTMQGNIVVDGVIASCYASYDHDLVHFFMIPVQWFPEIVDWIFGDDNGSYAYINIIKVFGRWMLPQEFMYN